MAPDAELLDPAEWAQEEVTRDVCNPLAETQETPVIELWGLRVSCGAVSLPIPKQEVP